MYVFLDVSLSYRPIHFAFSLNEVIPARGVHGPGELNSMIGPEPFVSQRADTSDVSEAPR